MRATPRLLLAGRPGVGKTTVVRRLVALLVEAGVPLSGFVTEEIRERGRRIGFRIETVAGERGTLAHVDFPGPPTVGRYGVDLAAFEKLALSALAPQERGVVVIDELGRMELASEAFVGEVTALFDRPVPVVATVLASPHPVTDGLKRRSEVEMLSVTPRNRDELPNRLARQLIGTR